MNFIRIFIFLISIIITSAQTGVFKSYHLNGKKSAEISYSDGIYDGTSYWFYENGNLKETKTFSNGKLNGWYRAYYESGLLKEEKYIKEGVTDGIHKLYFGNGALKSVLSYENGILVKRIDFEYDPYYQAPIEDYRAGNQQQIVQKKSDEFLCDVKICPAPLGGMESIYEKLIYPPDAIAYGLEGEVRLLATITKDGNVSETKVLRGIGLGCDEAAENAVKKTRFLPGQNESGPTTSNLTLTIKFKLVDGEPIVKTKPTPTYATERISEPEIGPNVSPAATKISEEPKTEIVEKDVTSKVDPTPQSATLKSSSRNSFECTDVDVCAKPKGGISSILNNFRIPKRVRDNNIKGEVVVLCVVDDKGKVRKTTVLQDLPEGASIAVEVAILDTKFEPGIKNGKPVRSSVTVTVPVDY